MDSSSLDSALSSLEQSISNSSTLSSRLEYWLPWMAALVVIGVSLELIEIFHERNEAQEDWESWHGSYPSKPKRWLFRINLAAVLLVTGGVFGELVLGLFVGKEAANIRNDTEKLLALVRQKSTIAEENAELAQSYIAELEAETARADLERQRLEARVAPRSLSLEQQCRMIDACKKFAGHRALISSYGLDGEGAALATQLLEILRCALGPNNVRSAISDRIVTGRFESGIHIRSTLTTLRGEHTVPDSERPFASALRDVLHTIGKLDTYADDSPPRQAHGAMNVTSGGETFPDGLAFVNVFVAIKPVPTLSGKSPCLSCPTATTSRPVTPP